MSNAANRYSISRQPEGVERVWKALERLGHKAKGHVPQFENNTLLKFWLASVRGRHELHGDRPKADGYARFLEGAGVALPSESHGLLIDLERINQLSGYFYSDALWIERDAEWLAARVRKLEAAIIVAEQSEDVDETKVSDVGESDIVEHAAVAEGEDDEDEVDASDTIADGLRPVQSDPTDRFDSAMARLEALRERAEQIDAVDQKIQAAESEFQRLDVDLERKRQELEAFNPKIAEKMTAQPSIELRLIQAQQEVSVLEAQLAAAREKLDEAMTESGQLTGEIESAICARDEASKALNAVEAECDAVITSCDTLEKQKKALELSAAEREEMVRIEALLRLLDSLGT